MATSVKPRVDRLETSRLLNPSPFQAGRQFMWIGKAPFGTPTPAAPLEVQHAAVLATSTPGTGTGIPEAPLDGIVYGRVSATWTPVLPIIGGALSGSLTLSADPTAPFNAATKQYVDAVRSYVDTIKSELVYVTPQQFGAKADAVTDDSGAFQAAHDHLGSLGGMVLIPSGQYSIQKTINITNPVRFVGAAHGYAGPYLYAGSPSLPMDITVFNLSAQCTLEHMTIYGCGLPGVDAGPFPATQPVLVINAGWCRLDDVFTQGGSHGFYQPGPAGECLVTHSTFALCYGSAAVYQANSGSMFFRSNNDQDFPGAQPAFGAIWGAWAASHAYTVGTIVSTQGFYIQCMTAGTSGAIAPGLKNYYVDIHDGTVVWHLVCPTTYYGFQFDTGVPVSQVIMGDHGTPGNASIAFTNTLGGAAPAAVQLFQCIINGAQHGIDIQAGSTIDITDCQPAASFRAGGAAIHIGAGCGGSVHIHGGEITACTNGVQISGGVNVLIEGVAIGGATNAGVLVDAGVSQFIIQGNTFGTGPEGTNAHSIIVSPGASNNYIIANNLLTGTTAVSDGGTGTNKFVGNNV